MLEESLIILRSNRQTEGNLGFGHRETRQTGGCQDDTSGDNDLTVEVKENDPRVYEEAIKDEKVFAVAPGMPFSLISPVANNATSFDSPEQAKERGCTWGIKAIGADRSRFTGETAIVAVLDTGINEQHPAFKDRGITIEQRDFTRTDNRDTCGHGTHCAGTIFGRDIDKTRIGVAPGVRHALVAKVIGNNIGTDALLSAFTWAVGKGANVISMSLGYDFTAYCSYWEAKGAPRNVAVSKALAAYRDNIRLFDKYVALSTLGNGASAGAIVVAAAGNESGREKKPPYDINVSSPAAAENVISVGAVSLDNNLFKVAPFSNTFPLVVGPGVDILSADKDGTLSTKSGTSMACPHVAGLAALYWDAFRGFDRSMISSRLQASTSFEGFAQGYMNKDVGAGMPVAP